MAVVDRMRIALCVAGLLHDVGKPLTDVRVHGRDRSSWNPFVEALTDWSARGEISEYRIEWIPGRNRRHERFTYLAAGRMVEPELQRYLATCGATVLQFMWEAVCPEEDSPLLLSRLVREADHQVSLEDLKAHRSRQKGGLQGHRADRFLEAVRALLNNQTWRVNTPGQPVFVTDQGAFLSWPVIVDPVLRVLREGGDTGYPSDPEELSRWLIDRGLAVPHFDPALKGSRSLTPFAPACLMNRMTVATVLWGLHLSSVDLLYPNGGVPEVERDLINEVLAGRLESTGAKLIGVRQPQPEATVQASAPSLPTEEKPPPDKSVTVDVEPRPEPTSKSPEMSASEHPASTRSDKVEEAIRWLTAETSKGRVLVREIAHRFASESGLRWTVDGGLWRARVVVAWPEAIADTGFDARSSLHALIEHGVLHHEPLRKDQGWTHQVELAGATRSVIAFKDDVSALLRPLLDYYAAKTVKKEVPAAVVPATKKSETDKERILDAFRRHVIREARTDFTVTEVMRDLGPLLGTSVREVRSHLLDAQPPLLIAVTENGKRSYQVNLEHPVLQQGLAT